MKKFTAVFSNIKSMKFINVILIVLCCLNSLNAQDTIQKKKIYRTWVSLNSEPFKFKGVLYEVKDSSILVSRSLVIKEYLSDRSEMVNLNINNIEIIRTRKNNNIGKGILIGALSGFIAGGAIGLISGDDPPDSFLPFTAGAKAMITGVLLSVAGADIGGVIGSFKVKIPINGSIDNYNRNKNKLRGYSVIKK